MACARVAPEPKSILPRLAAQLMPLARRPRFALIACFWFVCALRASDLPMEWTDPDTGHRIVQLSREGGTQSLYFTQNAYTLDGTRILVTSPTGLSAINLKSGEITKVVEGRVNLVVTGRKTGAIFYQKEGILYAMDPDTRVIRQVGKLPARGSVSTVNADETLAAGAITLGPPWAGRSGRGEDRAGGSGSPAPGGGAAGSAPPAGFVPPGSVANLDPPSEAMIPGRPVPGHDNYPGKGDMMERRLKAHLPMVLFTLNLVTGEYKEWLHSTDWLGHLQYSPADPTLLMYCHEGPWHKVDRIWTIRTEGDHPEPKLIHRRTIKMEIAGHEFWGADGKWIYYDLQTPRSEDFWVGSYNVETGARIWYHLDRSQWSVHYNVSRDGLLFSGDGGSPTGVGKSHEDQWIFLFRPDLVPDDDIPSEDTPLIQSAVFNPEKLVNMARHDYSVEPNATFSPDGKWLVFRSNMRGPTQVYAVEIARADPRPAAADPSRSRHRKGSRPASGGTPGTPGAPNAGGTGVPETLGVPPPPAPSEH